MKSGSMNSRLAQNHVRRNATRIVKYEQLETRLMLADSTPALAGLIGYWGFEEGSGATTVDASGGGHTGTVSGATWSGSGRVGAALSFDGSNDYVDTGSWDVASGAMTIAAWFRADDFDPQEARFVSKATDIGEQDHYWMLSTIDNDGPKLRFRLKANGTTKTLIADQGNLTAGQWMHAAALYDGAMMRLYLNGVEVGAKAHSGRISTNPDVRVTIGDNPVGSRPFDGLLDQVRIYDRALTPAEVAALVAEAPATAPPRAANLAPVVDAGPNRSVVVSAVVALDGSVSDDSLPNPAAVITTTWTKVSGPGAVTFGDASSVDTTVRFSQAGSYVLRLAANDGEFTVVDLVTIGVAEAIADNGQLEYYKSVYDQTYAKYKTTYDRMAASGWGPTYYSFQYAFGGAISMFEATQDATYLERALAWAETMISKATIVDYKGKLNWNGNWSASSKYAGKSIASFLDEIQGSTELARLARIIITNPTLNATYGTRATAIYNFLRDHVVNKELFDRNALSWHYTYAEDYTGRYYNDKNELLVRVMTDLIRANKVLRVNDIVQQKYTSIVTRLANAFTTRLVLASGDPRCGTYGVYSGDALIIDCGLHVPVPHAPDVSHANRTAALAIDLHEAGIVVERSDINGLALLINDVIWNGSLSSPKFTNRIDGNNDPILGKGPFGLGLVYSGWVKLAQYDAQTLAIFDATLRAIVNGVSNPSLDFMDNFSGRAALAGHLAKAVAHPASNLEAASVAAADSNTVLTQDQLQPIVESAISDFVETSLTQAQINSLSQIEFVISDLEGSLLGQATPQKITIDINAAGHGWFVDSTPDDDEEYDIDDPFGEMFAKDDSAAASRMDLTTVVMHELGHVMGYDHGDGHEIMAETLASGVRKKIETDAVDAVFDDEVFQ